MSLDDYISEDKKQECSSDTSGVAHGLGQEEYSSDTSGVAQGLGQEVDYSQTARLPLGHKKPLLPDFNLHLAQEEDDDEYSFEALSTDQIFQHIAECIQVVKEIIDNPATTTRILLSHFNWDKDKLIERYFDGNLDKLYSECHLVNPGEESLTCPPIVTISPPGVMPCGICSLDHPNTTFTGLGCGHKFCTQCWRDYLTTKIIEGTGLTISCPAHSCDILVDDNTIVSLITDSEVKLKYQSLIANGFVERNRLFKWCPMPDCHHVIKVEYLAARTVQCKCGRRFCFSCGENGHIPIKCKWLKKWMKNCTEEFESYSWIALNTKDCPGCHSPIEKYDGCNYMQCQNPSCRYEFCWDCLGPWEPKHSSAFGCDTSTFNEDVAKAARDAQEHSRAYLQKGLCYYKSYKEDMHSLRFEQTLYAIVQEKMEQVARDEPFIDMRFLRVAADVLCQCRSTLTFTYAFAFYLEKNNEAIIFQNNLADLASAVTVLSGYLEKDVASESLYDVMQKVITMYRYCEGRRRVLLQLVHEGYEKNLWEYRED